MDNYLIDKLGIITNTEDILLANKIYDEVQKKYKIDGFAILGCIYKCGKIEGIREERKKKK